MIKEAFSFMAIVKVLAMFRAKEANLRHRKVFYWQKFCHAQDPSDIQFSDVSQHLPSRRQWARPKRTQRHSTSRPSVDTLQDSIVRKVQGVYYAGRLQEFEWGRRLTDFVNRIQARVASDDIEFDKPELMLRTKAVGLGCRPKFRCISAYRNLEDRVILALANKYLARKFDSLLSEGCYAFRAGKSSPIGRAIGNIIDFRRTINEPLYVAECDIVKFFDTIEHDTVMAVFEDACVKVGLDDKAKLILKTFLASYDVRDVMHCDFWGELSKSGDWDFLSNLPTTKRIGLPQGGALSGLLSNLVLASVDYSVRSLKMDDLLYARYCDDIIIVSKREEDCQKAFDACRTRLESLGLRSYPCKQDVVYGSDYYTDKSKGPFAWGNPSIVPNAISWVSFLGYSIRYDGSARLRKETLLGHVKSIREECETFLSNAEKVGLRHLADKQKAIESFLYRLLSKGTGRIHVEPIKGLGRCWLSAFRFVGESKAGLKQMRYLDYVRSSAIDRLLRKLGVRLGDNKDGEKREGLYLGKPFSYYGSCERLRRKLISETYDLSVSDCEIINNGPLDNTGDTGDKPMPNAEDAQNLEDTSKDNDGVEEEPDIQDEEWVVSNWGRARGFGG